MSSPGSPTLDLDVRSRRIERAVALSAVVLILLASYLFDQPLQVIAVVTSWIAATSVAAGFWRAGWLGGRGRLVRVVWQSDRHWYLTEQGGQCSEATLQSDSRRGPGCVWLRWRSEDRYVSMLIGPGDLAAGQLRRLIVRLAVDGLVEPASVLTDLDEDHRATPRSLPTIAAGRWLRRLFRRASDDDRSTSAASLQQVRNP